MRSIPYPAKLYRSQGNFSRFRRAGKNAWIPLFLGALWASPLAASVIIDGVLLETGYSQNFNTLPVTGFTWVNNGTHPGWYAMNPTGTFTAAAIASRRDAEVVIENTGPL